MFQADSLILYRFGRKWTSFGMNILAGVLCAFVGLLQKIGMSVKCRLKKLVLARKSVWPSETTSTVFFLLDFHASMT